jgi:hypothetical protein
MKRKLSIIVLKITTVLKSSQSYSSLSYSANQIPVGRCDPNRCTAVANEKEIVIASVIACGQLSHRRVK